MPLAFLVEHRIFASFLMWAVVGGLCQAGVLLESAFSTIHLSFSPFSFVPFGSLLQKSCFYEFFFTKPSFPFVELLKFHVPSPGDILSWLPFLQSHTCCGILNRFCRNLNSCLLNVCSNGVLSHGAYMLEGLTCCGK